MHHRCRHGSGVSPERLPFVRARRDRAHARMNGQARVAVITPCYNSERFVAKTVESVAAQTVSTEHIVVDDGSTDRSLLVLQALEGSYPNLRLIQQPNAGVAAARKAGYQAAGHTEYVLFLDADDLLHPAMIEVMISYLDAHPSAGLAYCHPQLIDEDGIPLLEPQWPPRRYGPGRLLARRIPDDDPITPLGAVLTLTAMIIPSLAVMRRSAYELSGGWDEHLDQYCEDTDLFARIALASEIHCVPRRLVGHRRHANQCTARLEYIREKEDEFIRRWRRPPLHLSPVPSGPPCSRAWRFRDRQLVPLQAIDAASRRVRSGQFLTASRFLLGAVRIVLASYRPPDDTRPIAWNAPRLFGTGSLGRDDATIPNETSRHGDEHETDSSRAVRGRIRAMSDVSIVVCTRNKAGSLERCLELASGGSIRCRPRRPGRDTRGAERRAGCFGDAPPKLCRENHSTHSTRDTTGATTR